MNVRENGCFDVIILGAGASGLMAAMQAAFRGRKVLVIEHATKAGQKMLVSGGRKCNITNRRIAVTDYYGANPSFCKYAIKRFTTASILQLLREANIETEEREHGRIFCKKGANEIVSYLIEKNIQAGVHFAMDTSIFEVKRQNHVFSVICCDSNGQRMFESEHLLVATGGLAWPQIGASSIGYCIAKQFGHTILPLKPALTGYVLPHSSSLHHLQGISLDVKMQVVDKKLVIEEPLLFTHQGISGPATLQTSCFWEKGETIIIDFLPSEDLTARMQSPENGKLQTKNLISQFLPDRLVQALIPEQFLLRKVAELSKKERKIIADAVHRYPVLPEAPEDFTKAEVTSGGVSTSELDSHTMKSRIVKGLYFSGEVIDITGKLGGYNIHWAFASGTIAGQNI